MADIRETRTPSEAGAPGVESSPRVEPAPGVEGKTSANDRTTSAMARGSTGVAAMPRWDWARDAGVPLAIFAVTRALQIAILEWMLPPRSTLSGRLLSWDADWFIRVATHGYPHTFTYDSGGNLTGNELAFFPLYPWLIRIVDDLGIAPDNSALAVAWLAAAIASVLVYALVRRVAIGAGQSPTVARRIGYAFVVLCFAQPLSVVLSMGYSEPVFLALVAGMFLAAYRRWWLVAGLLGAAAGLTRPTGAAAAVGLTVAAVMCLADRIRPGREKVAAAVGSLIALAGVPAYIGWVGLRVHDLNAWFKIQTAGWGTTFDYGRSTWDFVTTTVHTGVDWVAISVVLILIAATVALVIGARQNAWLPLTVYGVLAYALVVGQAGFFHSKPRLMLPVLLVLLPAAWAAGRARPSRAAWWLAGYALFGLWYGAYMITVWQYAI
ncbi:MAG TPA: mannosyltransferase family protein [Micromonosporaceae bacterium]|nr:mannosyltransferase family protein [Micromonosporaceae bacterium]